MKHVIEFATERPARYFYELVHFEFKPDRSQKQDGCNVYEGRCQTGGILETMRIIETSPMFATASLHEVRLGTDLVLWGVDDVGFPLLLLHTLPFRRDFGPGQIAMLRATADTGKLTVLLQFTSRATDGFER